MNINKIFLKEWKSGTDLALLIIRIIFAYILISGHGFPKLLTAFSGNEIRFPDPIGIGSKTSFYLALFAESIVALFLMLGFLTRFSSLILIINFAVIIYLKMFVASSPITEIEHIIFYFFVFIALFFSGAGKFSIDRILIRNK